MGVIKGGVLGRVSGKIGDKSYRDCGDKTVVASLPKRDKNDHPHCIAPKKKLGHTSPLASYVNQIPSLEKIWRIADSNSLSAFHSMMSFNMNLASQDHLTIKNIISPPGISLKVSEVILSGGFIRAHLEITGGLIPPPLQAIVIIYACNPESENKDFHFYNITAKVTGPGDGKEFDVVFNPYPFTLNWIGSYQKYIMYFTLIKDDGSMPLSWTSTAAYEGTGNIVPSEN